MTTDAVKAGATFLIAPNCSREVGSYCRENDIIYIPGALSPTEVYNAWQESGVMVKLFPVSLLGPNYFTELKKPYKNIKLMAVGYYFRKYWGILFEWCFSICLWIKCI